MHSSCDRPVVSFALRHDGCLFMHSGGHKLHAGGAVRKRSARTVQLRLQSNAFGPCECRCCGVMRDGQQHQMAGEGSIEASLASQDPSSPRDVGRPSANGAMDQNGGPTKANGNMQSAAKPWAEQRSRRGTACSSMPKVCGHRNSGHSLHL